MDYSKSYSQFDFKFIRILRYCNAATIVFCIGFIILDIHTYTSEVVSISLLISYWIIATFVLFRIGRRDHWTEQIFPTRQMTTLLKGIWRNTGLWDPEVSKYCSCDCLRGSQGYWPAPDLKTWIRINAIKSFIFLLDRQYFNSTGLTWIWWWLKFMDKFLYLSILRE